MNYHFWIIGCQMNVADSERIARALNDHGHRQVGTAEDAVLVLLTSCTVRQGAEDRLWGEVGRLGRLKKARPDLVVAVTGCVTDGNVETFLRKQSANLRIFRVSIWTWMIPSSAASPRSA